jgi:hypothetical protein
MVSQSDDPQYDLGSYLDDLVHNLSQYLDKLPQQKFTVYVPPRILEHSSDEEISVSVAWLPELLDEAGVESDFIVSYNPTLHQIVLERVEADQE